ncbi:hypothetical protein C2E20_2624 [Micractinium conductrix]|uniref:BZIP domain-containing protein n=1 Tax=Micractinium conductrix TaxID=554055 RepID=A0A2P6VJ02_9CHLO|nr:hypothetical protein C2E20_2624 [Micractinium conductrix]|eukprot:PSC74037.1 hypothetical protein C2E20_2624 [Micractinium conductrix]
MAARSSPPASLGANSGAGSIRIAAAAVTSAPAPQGRGRARGGGDAAEAKGGKKALSEEQKERIKAKNRRAQTRYREKKKQEAAAAEGEYHATAAELARLRLENSKLQEQQTTMEKVLNVREDWMASLQEGKAAAEQEVAEADAARGGVPPPCTCGNPVQCSCGARRAGTAAGGGHLKIRELPPGASELSTSSSDAVCGAGEGSSSGDVLECGECPLTGLTLSQIAELKRTPPEGLQRRWRSIAERLAMVLQQMEAAAQSSDPSLADKAEQLQGQMVSVLQEGRAFCFEHAIYQPANVQRLFAASLDDGRTAFSAEDMVHWQAVAGSLGLSEAQLERLDKARTEFLRRIADVCAERRAIMARLQAAEVPDMADGGLRAMQHVTAMWLQVHEATADLTANMSQEHCVCMTFVRDAFGWVLSPHQKAVAIVKAYPFFPDMYSISTAALKAPHPAPLAGRADALEMGGGSARSALPAPAGSG